MSDFIHKRPFLAAVFFSFILFGLSFVTVVKPYIDKGDARNKAYVFEELIPRMDSVLANQQKGNELLRSLNDSDHGR
jgi:hypothetical protein